MNNKEFQKCVDNYIHMIVHSPAFDVDLQKAELTNITGLQGNALDKLYKRIGEAIQRPERTNSTRL